MLSVEVWPVPILELNCIKYNLKKFLIIPITQWLFTPHIICKHLCYYGNDWRILIAFQRDPLSALQWKTNNCTSRLGSDHGLVMQRKPFSMMVEKWLLNESKFLAWNSRWRSPIGQTQSDIVTSSHGAAVVLSKVPKFKKFQIPASIWGSAHRRLLSNAPMCFCVSAWWRAWSDDHCSQSQIYLLGVWTQWPISCV